MQRQGPPRTPPRRHAAPRAMQTGQRGHPARPRAPPLVRVRHQVDSDATPPKVSQFDHSHPPPFDATPQPFHRV